MNCENEDHFKYSVKMRTGHFKYSVKMRTIYNKHYENEDQKGI